MGFEPYEPDELGRKIAERRKVVALAKAIRERLRSEGIFAETTFPSLSAAMAGVEIYCDTSLGDAYCATGFNCTNATAHTCPTQEVFECNTFSCTATGHDCSATKLYDFMCSEHGGNFQCGSAGASMAFTCMTKHVFNCTHDFDCLSGFSCCGGNADTDCSGDYRITEEGGIETTPGQFLCGYVGYFDTAADFFDCTDPFTCGSSVDFTCTRFADFDCNGATADFECWNDFDCEKSFQCGSDSNNPDTNTFSCNSQNQGFDCSTGGAQGTDFNCSDYSCTPTSSYCGTGGTV